LFKSALLIYTPISQNIIKITNPISGSIENIHKPEYAHSKGKAIWLKPYTDNCPFLIIYAISIPATNTPY
jgi:hypothetical protein